MYQDTDYSAVATKELKQHKYPSTGDWLNKLRYILTKGHCAAKKKDETELAGLIRNYLHDSNSSLRKARCGAVYNAGSLFGVFLKKVEEESHVTEQ